jgi:hypothetical protein
MRLQAVALFGLGVGRVEQRHAALGPQPLDLIKVLSDVGGFLRRDAPPMGQPPRHLAPAADLAIPAAAATPAGWDWALRLLGAYGVHEDGGHVAAGSQLVEAVHRQQRSLAAALSRLNNLNGNVLVAVGQLPKLLGQDIKGDRSLVFGGVRARSAWRTAPHRPVDPIDRTRGLA